jgi:hypothetical protein
VRQVGAAGGRRGRRRRRRCHGRLCFSDGLRIEPDRSVGHEEKRPGNQTGTGGRFAPRLVASAASFSPDAGRWTCSYALARAWGPTAEARWGVVRFVDRSFEFVLRVGRLGN